MNSKLRIPLCWKADHFFLRLARPRRLLGYGRSGFGWLLDDNLANGRTVHRPEAWRRLGEKLQLAPIATAQPRIRPPTSPNAIVIHSGASQPLRVWPLDRYAEIVRRLRELRFQPTILCDAAQLASWRQLGETGAVVAPGMDELIDTISGGAAFLGNDSGPGHIAALCGVPTFTLFGPQVPELFAPGHPLADWVEGRACKYKPCFDRCRYAEPFCLTGVDVETAWTKMRGWLDVIRPTAAP